MRNFIRTPDLLLICFSVGEFINLEETINEDEIKAPICEAKFGASVSMFDHLPSIADKDKLQYSTENVLKDVSV